MTNSEKMIACLDQGDLKRADKYFKRALANDPEAVLLDLAEYLEAIGFYPQAKTIYDQLAAQHPHVNLSLAEIASADGDIDTAFDYLNRIDEDSPDYVTALLIMADLYDSEGLTDVAREKLLLAQDLTDEPLVTFGLAELELSLENYQTAINHYAQLDNRLILNQTGTNTYERIGWAYANLGKFEPALDFLEKAMEIDPDDRTLFELATVCYKLDNYQRANLYFKQLETLSPDFEGYEYAYALSLEAEGQQAEALRLTQQALRKNPFESQLLLLASQLAYACQSPDLAEDYLKEARANDTTDETVLFRLANLYLEQGREDEVLTLGLEASDQPLTRWLLAQSYQALEQEDEALALYDELAPDLSTNPDFLLAYGQALQAAGERYLAKQILTQYLQLVPDDAQIADWLTHEEEDW